MTRRLIAHYSEPMGEVDEDDLTLWDPDIIEKPAGWYRAPMMCSHAYYSRRHLTEAMFVMLLMGLIVGVGIGFGLRGLG